MQAILTQEQIARARRLRSEGMSFPDIAAAVGYDGPSGTIRGHCLDIDTPNPRKRAIDKPVRERSDGKGTIRTFSGAEDARIAEAVRDRGADTRTWPRGTMAELARELGRAQHSVSARIKTLQRQGFFG